MVQPKKLQDLEVNKKYRVMSRKEIITKYGKTYILKVQDESDFCDIDFQLYSPKYITTYIDQEKPSGQFQFTVTIENNMKLVKIENYNRDSDGFISF